MRKCPRIAGGSRESRNRRPEGGLSSICRVFSSHRLTRSEETERWGVATYSKKSLSSVGMVSVVRLDNRGTQELFVGLLAALAAGALLNCRLDAPRQSWSHRWGPVVPHQSFPGDSGSAT